MSKQKALFEQIADAAIYQLNEGTFPLQKPWVDGGANFVSPINATTGNKYKGMNALWLAMQNRVDPRWATVKQASMNELKIKVGEKGTLINFMKTNEMRPERGDKGQALRDEEGKLKYQTVDLENPVLQNAFLFNGEQIGNIKDYGEVAAELADIPVKSAVERIADLIDVAQVMVVNDPEIEFGISYYDSAKDVIFMPPVEDFDTPEKYNAALLHEFIHWTGHESRLNRELPLHGTRDYAKEELTAEIASLMLGSELNISHELGHHALYVSDWVQMLQQEPFELHRAASDAQRIVDAVLGLELNRELSIDASPQVQRTTLAQNDLIRYQNNQYKVQGILKGNTAQMMEMNTGRRFKLSPQDGLYKALLTVRNLTLDAAQKNTQEVEQVPEIEQGAVQSQDLRTETEQAGFDHSQSNDDLEGQVKQETAVASEVQEEVKQSRSRRR